VPLRSAIIGLFQLADIMKHCKYQQLLICEYGYAYELPIMHLGLCMCVCVCVCVCVRVCVRVHVFVCATDTQVIRMVKDGLNVKFGGQLNVIMMQM